MLKSVVFLPGFLLSDADKVEDWVWWGLGPAVSSIVGYLIPVIVLELMCNSSLSERWAITYSYSKSGMDRSDRLAKTREKVPFKLALKTVVWNMLGPTVILNGFLSWLILSNLVFVDKSQLPSFNRALVSFVLLRFIDDFFLYWGHRIQHMNLYLWTHVHSVHHRVDTPSPFYTAYLDSLDTTLQVGVPLVLSTLLVQPHPVIMWACVTTRVAENVVNHSGLECSILNIMYLKVLPGRASVSHHDNHHRFSGEGGGKNFAESFWIWDYIFGTYRDPTHIRDPVGFVTEVARKKTH